MDILQGWNSEVIDWDKYKIILDTQEAENSFIDLCIKLFEVNGSLVGDYKGSNKKTEMAIGNIVATIRPDDFCRSVYDSILKFRETLKRNNDRLLEYIEYGHKGLKVRILLESGEIEETTIMKYNNFDALTKRKGELNPQWKGGVHPVSVHLRAFIKRSQWQFDSYKATGSKCVITGKYGTKNNRVHLHHLYSFNAIVRETMENLNLDFREEIGLYSNEEIKSIERMCLKLHYKYGLGVSLLEDLHREFHSLYGAGDNTPEQFEEFKNMKLKELKKAM